MPSRSLAPAGGNDIVYTPTALAYGIIQHYAPTGRCVDPCRGGGAFADHMPGCDWFEIEQGRDWLSATGHWDWAITNPPWGRRFLPILQKAVHHCDNVVFLCNINVWYTKARLRLLRRAGFGIVEHHVVPTPKSPWPQSGFALAATHICRDYSGPTQLTFSYPQDY